jgi:hypothetical protein
VNESAKHAIEDVKVLWPYLNSGERIMWTHRLMPFFENDIFATVKELSGDSWGGDA